MRPKLEKERAVLEKLRAQKQALIDQIPVEDRIKNALGSFVSGSVGIGAGMLDSIAVASQRLSASLPDWMHRAVGDNPEDANAKSVEDFRAGKEKAFGALVGQAMKATKGKANPAQVNEVLKARLG